METDDLYVFQNKCLTLMGGTLNASRIYIFEHHHETDTMDNTFEGKVGNGGTVLLIEDETSVRNTAKAMLTRLGYAFIEAQDGVKAVRLFQDHQNEIDCIKVLLFIAAWNFLEAISESCANRICCKSKPRACLL